FLDVYIQDSSAIVWIKTADEKLIRLEDSFINSFYIEPTEEACINKLIGLLESLPSVYKLSVVDKIVSLENKITKKLLRIELADSAIYNHLIKSLKNHEYVKNLYNIDLKPVQKYLFEKLKVEPTSKVIVYCKGDKLISINKIDDYHDIYPPPFRMLFFDIKYSKVNKHRTVKSIYLIEDEKIEELKGTEEEIARSFYSAVKYLDPDLLYSYGGEKSLLALKELVKNRFDLYFGRSKDRHQIFNQGSCAGRIFLGNVFYGFNANKFGLAGLVERTRFAFAPLGLATRWLSNKSIDSRNCFELIQRGYVIPKEEYFEPVRNLANLFQRDRGGITFTPEVGKIHENIAAIDFDSQYPNIILRNNLSYEGIDCINSFRLMPNVIKNWLERRLYLKKLLKGLKGEEKLYCQERINSLKLILVTFYGISGCCWNRFGNVLTFEEINRVSREVMYKAKDIVERKGFKIIYGDVDSLFISKKDASVEDYEEVIEDIKLETGLPVSLDKHFKFLVFLRTKSNQISALKRYFGVTYDGEVEARGIELRRNDFPLFVRDFQNKLIREIFSFNTVEEIYKYGVFKGLELLKQSLREICNRRVPIKEIIVSKRLRKNIKDYRVNVAHKIAALQLIILKNYEINKGDEVFFIYKSKEGINKASAYELSNNNYSIEIYSKMLYSAAETVYKSIGINLKQLLEKSNTNSNLLDWIS
ncbi:MAG: DNA polymerase domain-containing protein, partial [Thermoproteota archaeon]